MSDEISPLSESALRSFIILRDFEQGTGNILHALLPFFEPELTKVSGEMLNSTDLASAVKDSYNWEISASVVENFIPLFEEKDWVELIQSSKPERHPGKVAGAYKVTIASQVETKKSVDRSFDDFDILREEAENFFEKRFSVSSNVVINIDDFMESLVIWLVEANATSINSLKNMVDEDDLESDQHEHSLYSNRNLDRREFFLCYRFVDYVLRENNTLSGLLCGLAKVGIIADLARQFSHPGPVDRVKRSNLSVFLDTPLLLMFLGTHGPDASNDVDYLIQKLHSVGASVHVFEESVEEMRGILKVFLDTPPYEREGPTARAIRAQKVSVGLVERLAANPTHFIREKGIQITKIPPNISRMEEHWSEGDEENLYSKLEWIKNVAAREHDTKIVSNIMRFRCGQSSSSFFSCGYLFVTGNTALINSVDRFLSNSVMGPSLGNVGPLVGFRHLSAITWLGVGNTGVKLDEFPSKLLLANCESIAAQQTKILNTIGEQIKNITPELNKEFEVLLSEPRAQKVLYDYVAMIPGHIISNEKDIHELREIMRDEIDQKNSAKIKSQSEEIFEANEKLKASAQKIAIKASKQIVYGFRILIVALAFLASYFIQEILTDNQFAFLNIFVSIIFMFGAFWTPFDAFKLVKRAALWRFKTLTQGIGLYDQFSEKFEIEFKKNRLEIKDK